MPADVETGAYVLLDVFLAVLKRRLAELGSYLRRRVVHKLPVRAKDVAGRPALLLVGSPAVALLLRLRRARRRRRRSELGDCGNMLRHRVVQGGRLPVRRPLHGEAIEAQACVVVGAGEGECRGSCGVVRRLRLVGRQGMLLAEARQAGGSSCEADVEMWSLGRAASSPVA